MKIGVISDTHIPLASPFLPKEVISGLKGMDFILHAGDLVDSSVLSELKKIAPTYAVRGNMDSKDLLHLLPGRLIMPVGKFKIGLFHGFGSPSKLVELLKEEFKNEKLDAIIFGHSHYPFNEVQDGILFFNPGSPTDKVFSPYNSFGILDISDKITGRIVKIS